MENELKDTNIIHTVTDDWIPARAVPSNSSEISHANEIFLIKKSSIYFDKDGIAHAELLILDPESFKECNNDEHLALSVPVELSAGEDDTTFSEHIIIDDIFKKH